MISVGIDIGQFSIKISQLEEVSGTTAILKLDEFPLSQDPNKDRKIEIVDILRTYIASELPEDSIQFVLSLPEWQTAMRKLVFPFKERHKILKSLAFELEDDIPFSQEDSIFDAKITNYRESAAQVIAIAAPEDYIATKVQLAKDCGLDLASLTVDSLALSNLVTKWYVAPPILTDQPPQKVEDADGVETEVEVASPTKEKLDVLLNIGHSNTSVIFFRDGVVKAIRNIDWGGEFFGEEVASKYSIHYIEALKEVRKKGFLLTSDDGASKDQKVFSETLKAGMKELIHSLRLTFLQVESELNAEVERGYLTGGVAQLKNLGPFLTQSLEVAFNSFQYFGQFGHSSEGQAHALEPRFSQSIGLAIEGLKKPRNPAINLLKGRFSKEGDGLKPIWEKWGHAIQVGLAAWLALFIWDSVRTDFARDMADQAHADMKILGEQVAGLSRIKASSPSAIRRFLVRQKKVEKNREAAVRAKNVTSAMDIMQQLSASLPQSNRTPIDVRQLRIDKEKVLIEGETTSRNTVQQVKSALQQLATGGRVTAKPPTLKSSAGKTLFRFEFAINRKGPKI